MLNEDFTPVGINILRRWSLVAIEAKSKKMSKNQIQVKLTNIAKTFLEQYARDNKLDLYDVIKTWSKWFDQNENVF